MPFSTGYQEVKLGDVIDIRDGTHDTPKYVESGIPLITSKNLSDSGLSFQDISYISELDHDEISKRSAVENGDILYGMIGTIGKPTLVDTERVFSIKNVALFKQSNPEIHNRYLLRLLNSSAINKQIARASKGGTQKFVGLGALRNLRATFPPLPEQRRIAAILDQADALRAKRREALAQLDSLTQSIFVEMFGRHTNFPICSLNELCELITDGTHQTPEYAESGTIFLSAKNVTSGFIDWENIKFIPEHLHVELHRRLAPKLNDILLAKNGTTGVAAIVDRDCTFDIYVSLALLRPSKDTLPMYLLGAINSPVCSKQFKGALKGIGVPNLHLKEIRATQVPNPPLEIQQEFSRRIESLNLLKKQHEASLLEIDKLFVSLQHRAFRGEL